MRRARIRFVLGVAVALAMLVSTVGVASPANAATISYFRDHMQNRSTGRCVDDSYAYGLRGFPCNGLEWQIWEGKPLPDGTVELENDSTRRCLDDSFAYGLRTFPCNGLGFQRWIFYNSEGYWALYNSVTYRCLDDSFAYGLRTFKCNNLEWQHWIIPSAW